MEGTTYGENGHGIPVLTYEEMAGLVLGYDPWALGMQMHQVDVEPLLDKMGIEYDRRQVSRQERKIHRQAGRLGDRLLFETYTVTLWKTREWLSSEEASPACRRP